MTSISDIFNRLDSDEYVLAVIGIIIVLLVLFSYIGSFFLDKKLKKLDGDDEVVTMAEKDRQMKLGFGCQTPLTTMKGINQAEKDTSALSGQIVPKIDNAVVRVGEQQSMHGDIVREIKNADGTITNNIEFDLTGDMAEPTSVSPKIQYLGTANSGQFRKLLSSEEKCFFKTWEENGVRKFEFHGNVDKALANINAIFDDVCEIEGKQNGATQIINVEPGVLNSELKVEVKAKIRLS